MAKRAFTKIARTIPDLISFLESKGLLISDHSYAVHCLSYIGYYRLKIYMRPFETPTGKIFKKGTTFEQIVEIYEFDRKLRLLCLDAIERIEVAIRAHLVNVMGLHGGPHFYYEEKFFVNKNAVTDLRQLGERGKHLSITHYRTEYDDPHLPAIWCLTEAATLGQISRYYADLDLQYRKEIAKGFGFDETVCLSWFRTLTALRNTCAHHGRLWNAEMKADAPKVAKILAADLSVNTRCYSRLVILRALLNCTDLNGSHAWTPRLKELIANRPASADLSAMGFPVTWETHSIWT